MVFGIKGGKAAACGCTGVVINEPHLNATCTGTGDVIVLMMNE